LYFDRFGGQFSALYGNDPGNHFDSMWLACCTFYQLMTGEDWDGVMKKAINAKGAFRNESNVWCFVAVQWACC